MEKIVSVTFFLELLILPLFGSLTGNRCFWRAKPTEKNGKDLWNDCTFSVRLREKYIHRDDFNYLLEKKLPPRKLQHVLTLMYTLEEINSNSNLLPNISLEFSYTFASCSDFSLYNKLDELRHYHWNFPNYMCLETTCDIVLSGPTWEASAILGPFLQHYRNQQVSYGPFHPILSDQDNFPYLHQVAPMDKHLPFAMVSLMLHFSWTWVGLVTLDDDQGIQFLSDLREEMQKHSICLAFVNVIPVNMELYMKRAERYYNQIVTSSASVGVIYGTMMNPILEVSLRSWKFLGTKRIWITTSHWDFMASEGEFIPDSFHGTITFSHHHGDISGFKSFIQTMNISEYPENFSLEKLGWMHCNCSLCKYYLKSLQNTSSNTSLDWLQWLRFDLALDDESYNIYNAVYAMAHAFQKMIVQGLDFQSRVNESTLMQKCLQVHDFLKNIQFINPIGDVVNMNKKGQLGFEYDIHIISNFPHGPGLKMKIGEFSLHSPQSQHLYLSKDMLELTTGTSQLPPSVCSVTCSPGFRKSRQEGQAACCTSCSRCPINEISNETDSEQCVKCPDDQYANGDQNICLEKSVTFLAYEDPLGMALACLALCFSALTALVLGVFWKHQDTPIVKANNRTLSYILLISLKFCFLCSLLFIGHPNTATCILQQITFGVLFTVAVSTVLAKTVTVVLAFKVTAPGRRMRGLLVSGAPNFIIPICTLFQLILCAVWLGTSPPFIDTDTHSEHGHIIIFCNKGSVTAFYCVLGYLGSLALVSFTVAFLARNLPDKFNEAKFLTFSMLVFLSVWVTFLPVYQSSKGKFLVAVEVFSILASSAGLLGCIFVPKCYIILLRPDRNFLHKFSNKNKF